MAARRACPALLLLLNADVTHSAAPSRARGGAGGAACAPAAAARVRRFSRPSVGRHMASHDVDAPSADAAPGGLAPKRYPSARSLAGSAAGSPAGSRSGSPVPGGRLSGTTSAPRKSTATALLGSGDAPPWPFPPGAEESDGSVGGGSLRGGDSSSSLKGGGVRRLANSPSWAGVSG